MARHSGLTIEVPDQPHGRFKIIRSVRGWRRAGPCSGWPSGWPWELLVGDGHHGVRVGAKQAGNPVRAEGGVEVGRSPAPLAGGAPLPSPSWREARPARSISHAPAAVSTAAASAPVTTRQIVHFEGGAGSAPPGVAAASQRRYSSASTSSALAGRPGHACHCRPRPRPDHHTHHPGHGRAGGPAGLAVVPQMRLPCRFRGWLCWGQLPGCLA